MRYEDMSFATRKDYRSRSLLHSTSDIELIHASRNFGLRRPLVIDAWKNQVTNSVAVLSHEASAAPYTMMIASQIQMYSHDARKRLIPIVYHLCHQI